MRPLRRLVVVVVAFGCSRQEAPAADPEPAASELHGSASSAAPQTANDDVENALIDERRAERERLVDDSIRAAGIDDPRVLAAMRKVPRHLFVPEEVRSMAYRDRPLPIGWGQTISQPYIVAAMTQAVGPRPTDKCLEIGTGSGYQAAVLAEVCGEVYSIEYLPGLAEFGAENLRSTGYRVHLRTGDGYLGWPDAAPFDVIVVTAAPEKVPAPLLAQLAVGGRLVIPVGPEHGVQRLELHKRVGAGESPDAFERQIIADVRFVPFLGDHADRERSD